jgi:hypothetical protein
VHHKRQMASDGVRAFPDKSIRPIVVRGWLIPSMAPIGFRPLVVIAEAQLVPDDLALGIQHEQTLHRVHPRPATFNPYAISKNFDCGRPLGVDPEFEQSIYKHESAFGQVAEVKVQQPGDCGAHFSIVPRVAVIQFGGEMIKRFRLAKFVHKFSSNNSTTSRKQERKVRTPFCAAAGIPFGTNRTGAASFFT